MQKMADAFKKEARVFEIGEEQQISEYAQSKESFPPINASVTPFVTLNHHDPDEIIEYDRSADERKILNVCITVEEQGCQGDPCLGGEKPASALEEQVDDERGR